MKNLTFSKVSMSLTALALLAVFSLTGCGEPTKRTDSTTTTSNSIPQIMSVPEKFAKAGNAYIYKFSASDNDGDALTYSLTKAPSGMEINPATGTISWIPSSSQGGEQDITVQVTDGKNTQVQLFKVRVETTANLASNYIAASTGGTVAVTNSASVFKGTQITIPAGALSSDTTIYINEVSNPSYLPAGIPAFEVVTDTAALAAPSVSGSKAKFKAAAFLQPVKIPVTVQYSDDILNKLGSWSFSGNGTMMKVPLDESKLEVYAGGIVPEKIVSRDLDHNIITVTIDHPFDRITIGPSWLMVVEQKRAFEGSEDAFWSVAPQGRNLLIIHGINSSSDSFKKTTDFIEYFKNNYYDNVLFYNYPSFEPIENNAQALYDYIVTVRKSNAKFDIVAHSMGGLVSRYLIEKLQLKNVEHLFMVGTPNFGGDLTRWVLPMIIWDSPGGSELFRLDKPEPTASTYPNFLDSLNFAPGLIKSRWPTNYYWYTGNVGDGTDERVAVPQPSFLTLLGLSEGESAKTYPYNHSELHEKCATNGICDEIKNVLTATSSTDTTPSVSSFNINNDASSTTSRTVILNNTATGSPTQYMASESSTFNGAGWQTYSTAPSFTLSSGNAAKMVYFKVKNSTGESTVISDSISLNETTTTQYTLIVSKSGTGSGTITSSTGGISCGNTCSSSYNSGASVTLTASASSGSTFAGWSGGGCSGTGTCSATMNAATTITATFTATAAATPPTAPSGLAALPASNFMSLAWNDNSSNETGFYVERKTGVSGSWSQIASVEQNVAAYLDYGVSAGVTYYYRVSAYNASGNSGYSNETSVTITVSDTTPPTINAFTVSSSTGTLGQSFTISYTVSDSGGSGLKQIGLWRANISGASNDSSWTQIGSAVSLSGNGPYSSTFTDTPTSVGNYWYGIHVIDNANPTVVVHESVPLSVTVTSGTSTPIERITNSSFSSGTSGWTLYGDFWAGTNLTRYYTSPGYASGGVDSTGSTKINASGSMYQAVTIPSTATSATLNFWLNITSDEATTTTQYDKLFVEVLNSSGSVLATLATYSNLDKGSACGTTCTYNQKSFNLTSYKGQTIRIQFRATTDSASDTVFRIDDVSLMADGNY